MQRYFINPELKRSSVVLIMLVVLFLLTALFVLRLQYDHLKDDYVGSMGAIAARVIAKDPELEKEIIPLITKEVSAAEAVKGKKLLRQYGLDDQLEVELFPKINTIVNKNNLAIILIFTLMAVILFILNYLQFGFFYERIRRLTTGAKKVVDGEYDLAINEDREGDLSKLATAFNSMREVIRNSLSDLQREKQFLVDLLSDISHQLKTPLSSMIVYNDIMLNKELPAEKSNSELSALFRTSPNVPMGRSETLAYKAQ